MLSRNNDVVAVAPTTNKGVMRKIKRVAVARMMVEVVVFFSYYLVLLHSQ
jgi:hypothetical protein